MQLIKLYDAGNHILDQNISGREIVNALYVCYLLVLLQIVGIFELGIGLPLEVIVKADIFLAHEVKNA